MIEMFATGRLAINNQSTHVSFRIWNLFCGCILSLYRLLQIFDSKNKERRWYYVNETATKQHTKIFLSFKSETKDSKGTLKLTSRK